MHALQLQYFNKRRTERSLILYIWSSSWKRQNFHTAFLVFSRCYKSFHLQNLLFGQILMGPLRVGKKFRAYQMVLSFFRRMKKKTSKKQENNHFLILEVQNITYKAAFWILTQDSKNPLRYREEFGSSFLFRAQRIMEFWEKYSNSLNSRKLFLRYYCKANMLFKFKLMIKHNRIAKDWMCLKIT